MIFCIFKKCLKYSNRRILLFREKYINPSPIKLFINDFSMRLFIYRVTTIASTISESRIKTFSKKCFLENLGNLKKYFNITDYYS